MKPIRLGREVAAIAGASSLLIASTASAAQWQAPKPTLDQIEALCPGVGGNPIMFGEPETNSADEDFETRMLSAQSLAGAGGFERAQPVFTDWSRELAGVDYETVVPADVSLEDWLDHTRSVLSEGDWIEQPDAEMTMSIMARVRLEKDADTVQGPRRLAIELDTFGMIRGFEMRCADVEYLVKDSEEKEGRLAEGSPRPVLPNPANDADIATWLASIDCTDPDLVERLGAIDDPGLVAGIFLERFGELPDFAMGSVYQERLNRWLRWRLANGGMTEDEIFEVEIPGGMETGEAEFEALMGGFAAIALMKDDGGPANGTKVCAGLKGFFEAEARMSNAKAARLARQNEAFIAAAKKRGLQLD